MGLPHVLQNGVAKLRACGRSKCTTDASPRRHQAPRLLRSLRKNVPSRSLFGSASNSSSGLDRTVPQPQRRPRRICRSPGMPPFSSPRPEMSLAQRLASLITPLVLSKCRQVQSRAEALLLRSGLAASGRIHQPETLAG
jgi:hypothetical protein